MPSHLLLAILGVPLMAFGAEDCIVHLRVVDIDGAPAPYALTEFVDAEGRNHADRFVSMRGQVPCQLNAYRFTVKRRDTTHPLGFLRGTVFVSAREKWHTIVTNPTVIFVEGKAWAADYRSAGEMWQGHIEPPSARLWVQIRAVFGKDHYLETATDSRGDFRVYESLHPGPYLLSVTNEAGKVLHVMSFTVDRSLPRETLQITLPKEAPKTIVR